MKFDAEEAVKENQYLKFKDIMKLFGDYKTELEKNDEFREIIIQKYFSEAHLKLTKFPKTELSPNKVPNPKTEISECKDVKPHLSTQEPSIPTPPSNQSNAKILQNPSNPPLNHPCNPFKKAGNHKNSNKTANPFAYQPKPP